MDFILYLYTICCCKNGFRVFAGIKENIFLRFQPDTIGDDYFSREDKRDGTETFYDQLDVFSGRRIDLLLIMII